MKCSNSIINNTNVQNIEGHQLTILEHYVHEANTYFVQVYQSLTIK